MNAIRSLVSLVLFLSASAGLAQNAPPVPAPVGVPKESPLFLTAAKTDELLDERLFPLGWSADGKFAWVSRRISEASDDCRWTFSILDTATNRVIQSDDATLPLKTGDTITKFWAKNQAAITAVLANLGIKMAPATMNHLPVVLGKRRNLVVSTDLAVVEARTEHGPTGVKLFKLTLRLGDAKSVVLDKTYPEFMPLAVGVAGCFHSPDERFGVIVVTTLERGYEGAPHIRRIESMTGVRFGEP